MCAIQHRIKLTEGVENCKILVYKREGNLIKARNNRFYPIYLLGNHFERYSVYLTPALFLNLNTDVFGITRSMSVSVELPRQNLDKNGRTAYFCYA